MTVAEIYQMLGDNIRDGIPEEWREAVLNIEHSGANSASFSGFYFDIAGNKIKNFETKFGITYLLAVKELHSITTAESSNQWNRLRYTLYPDQSFEVDFIWDEDLAEEMAYINSTMHVPEPRRGDGLSELKDVQRARKTERLYQAIAQTLLTNAPAGAWQQLVLMLTQPPLRYEAEVQWAPGRREALLLLGEAGTVEALYEFTGKGEHLRWEKAQVVVQPDGQYRFRFEWAGAGEYNLPTPYYREGQVDRPPASA